MFFIPRFRSSRVADSFRNAEGIEALPERYRFSLQRQRQVQSQRIRPEVHVEI